MAFGPVSPPFPGWLLSLEPRSLAASLLNAVAAGALLTLIANTTIPEAVEEEQKATGVLVVLGLLIAFALSNGRGASDRMI